MQITRDLEKAIANDIDAIKSIEVDYKNGENVVALIRKVTFIPLEVILCKQETEKGEDAYFYLDFENVVKISLLYHNGEVKVFE